MFLCEICQPVQHNRKEINSKCVKQQLPLGGHVVVFGATFRIGIIAVLVFS